MIEGSYPADIGDAMARKLLKAVEEFYIYIERNCALDTSARSIRCSGPSRGGFTVATRVKTLNHELGAVSQHWYPDQQLEEEPLAASPQLFDALIFLRS